MVTNVNGRCILVVDDHCDNLELMELTLTRFGYKVVASDSMHAALHTFEKKEHKYDAIVTDYWLGDGTGVELVQKMGAGAPCVRVLTTGHADVNMHRLFDAFLLKPITPERLQEVISQLLDDKGV